MDLDAVPNIRDGKRLNGKEIRNKSQRISSLRILLTWESK